MACLTIIATLLGLALMRKIWETFVVVVWNPYAVTRWFKKQGVEGPPYKLMKGNIAEIKSMKEAGKGIILDVHSHDFIPKVLPHYLKWSEQYGKTFLYWVETRPRICVMDVDTVKQILSNKFGFYIKEKPKASILALLGRGLVLTEGSDWARHRRVVSPAFTMEKLKTMSKSMAMCTLSMLDGWHDQLKDSMGESVVIEMNQQFQELTADVICHTAFGKSYAEGNEVFKIQKELQNIAASTILNMEFPGYKYLPTRNNRKRWALDRRVKDTLTKIIQGRLNCKDSCSYGDDLLGLLMDASQYQHNYVHGRKRELKLGMDEIIDECKTFFFAGHETTSHLLTWTMFLLASNPEWQQKLKEEVLRECRNSLPDADGVSKLKLVQMVLHEALRLYNPVIMLVRRSAKDMKLGSIEIPKNTAVTIPIALIHRSKELWGPDACEFNPLRFENGLSKAAKHPNALISFSLGPRSCVGQNFAMLEARIVMAMILQRYSFSLSQDYRHAPLDILTLQPQYGLPIVLKPLKA